MGENVMNVLGVHALLFTNGWNDDQCARAIDMASGLGFQVLELPVLEPRLVERMRRQLERAGLGVVVSLGLDPAADVSSGDPEQVARGEARLGLALSVARDLGAPLLTGVLYSACACYTTPPSEAGRWNSIRVLQRLTEKAAEAGVRIGIEPVNRYQSNLVNTAAQALALIDEVGADNMVVHLDSAHMHVEETDPGAAIERCGARLGYIHVAESHRGYLGSGSVDFGAMFAALARVGYNGTITFEAYTASHGHPKTNAALAIWRDLWSDGRDVARHARQFMAAEAGAAARRVAA
jgi:D-psicose/D-tagatose/L-ribulose 3-epimerase